MVDPPLVLDEPALLPPVEPPPRDVALPPVDEPLEVGRRVSCANAGTASASVKRAL